MNSVKLRTPVTDRDHTIGPRNAPIELVEYGDYECPYCGMAHPVIQQILKDFEDGIFFVFRNFPLANAHPHAMSAAKAAEASGLQGKFWEMHDVLYENQNSLDNDSLVSYVAELGLNLKKFMRDVNSAEVEEKIMSDFYSGARSGVNGTPSFFMNGYRYDGDWSYHSLSAVLAPMLKKAA